MPPVLVPSGGTLNVNYEIQSETGKPGGPLALVQRILDTQNATARGGIFSVEKSGTLLHVVPVQVRDASGEWVKQSSVVDVHISIANAPRTFSEMLSAICDAVSKSGNTRLLPGTGPSFYERDPPMRGAQEEIARDVLVRTFESTGRKVLWRILYSPSGKHKVLNYRVVSAGTISAATPPAS